MQRATGQHDRLARIPGAGPRQSSGRGPFASGYRRRATPRPARGMEPTVRSARTQSAIGSDADITTGNSRPLPSQFVLKFRPRERNFWMQRLEAKNPPERPLFTAETTNAQTGQQDPCRKRAIFDRRRLPRFGKTEWWGQSGSNCLPPTQTSNQSPDSSQERIFQRRDSRGIWVFELDCRRRDCP